MAGSFTGGAGGLFSGLAQGLQLLAALRQTEENQRLAQERNDLLRNQDTRDQATFEEQQANKPYLNQQAQLNKRNVVADLDAVRREYTPTPEADTYAGQITNRFTPPTFNAAPEATGPSFGKPALRQQSGPPSAVPNLNTSHIAQVLERAKRRNNFDLGRSALDQALTAAETKAQQTQLPVSEGLPQGFEAQPDKTFQPYQYGAGSNREADRLARAITMLRSRIPADALKLLDLGTVKPGEVAKIYPGAQADLRHLVELQTQYESLIGAVNAGAGRGQVDIGTSQQQTDWDNAAAALRTQGKNPEDVLGPRP